MSVSTITLYEIKAQTTSYDNSESLRSQRKLDQEREKKRGKWKNFASASGIFSTKFPSEYEYKIFPFQFNDHSVAFTTEITSSLNGLKHRSKEKSILVKAVQTFGPELSLQDVNKVFKRETEKYEQAAEALNGTLLTNQKFTHDGGFLGKQFYIAYEANGKKYGLRVQVIMTNYAKIEQVITGPANSIYSFRSNDFLKSIKPEDGRLVQRDPKTAVPMGTGWIPHTSHNNIFTVKLPPQNAEYTPEPVSFSSKPQKEEMSFRIIDPILLRDVYYKVTAYKLNAPVTFAQAKKVIATRHISKYVKNATANNVNFDTQRTDRGTVLKSKLIITPTSKFPNISNIFFETRYIGDTLVVQEFLTSNIHAKSEMHSSFFSLLDFHPEKYKPAVKKTEKTNQ